MASAQAPVGQSRARAPARLRRRPDSGALGGVCAGVAERIGAPSAMVRAAMVALAAFGGLGIAVYALAWALIPAGPASGGRAGRWLALREALGTVLAVFVAFIVLHQLTRGLRFGAAIGLVAIVAAMLGLLVVPWLVRLVRSLSLERAARIREQERADVAAHLHDSVLQTLALIQKRAGDPREVAGLARRQERELRSWLLERPGSDGRDTIAAALERAAAEVEELHGVPIEVVTVGDGPLDGRLEALVQAAREAMTNAAKFAGSERVDLYAEVAKDSVEVYVRDRGVGFDPQAIPADRRGVRDSIVGRMQRHRGRAEVHSRPGEGTEVELAMARSASA
jgi:signal transduction histidine kinase